MSRSCVWVTWFVFIFWGISTLNSVMGVVMLRFNGTTESHPLPQSSENIGEEEAERLRESDVLKLLQNCDSCSLAGPLYTWAHSRCSTWRICARSNRSAFQHGWGRAHKAPPLAIGNWNVLRKRKFYSGLKTRVDCACSHGWPTCKYI